MKLETDTNLEDKIIFSDEIILKFMRNTAEKISDMTNMTFIGLNVANDKYEIYLSAPKYKSLCAGFQPMRVREYYTNNECFHSCNGKNIFIR